MNNHSYNAGYHRGLNTEYHNVPINILFTKWIADVRRPASGEAFDIVAFEKGYNDGKDDYLCGGNTPERVEEQVEWLKKVAEQKEINKMVDQVESAAVKAAHKVMEQHSEAFEKLAEKRVTDEIKELKKQVEELKKENAELQRELSVHNFLDTGVPQERLDYQRELKKEIIRLKSLNRRAADEIRDLDNIIIDFVEGNAFPHKNEDDLWAGESSINLLNRLDGRTKGGYVENYEDLLSEMKAIDGE